MMLQMNQIRVFALVVAFVLLWAGASQARGKWEEDQVKALFLYNLLLFVDWPEGVVEDRIRLGITGDDELLERLGAFEGKKIKGKELVVHRWDLGKDSCPPLHALFIGASERDRLPQILQRLGNQPVLTMSDISGFAEQGGMVCFAYLGPWGDSETYRKRFEVNLSMVKRTGLFLRASLLRLSDIINDL